jgi:ribonuclease HI
MAIGYPAHMKQSMQLEQAAYKRELSASRRLAERTGMPPDQALRLTLEKSAGAAGLAALLAARSAEALAVEQRAAARIAARQAALARRQARHHNGQTAWRAWFDGSARPNPGHCAIGALLHGPGGAVIEIARPAGYGNSSEAEYRALIALLEAAVSHGSHQLTIYGDSQVVVNDVNGPAHQAARALLPYRAAARALLAQLREVNLCWIPRHKNSAADALAQRGACSTGSAA